MPLWLPLPLPLRWLHRVATAAVATTTARGFAFLRRRCCGPRAIHSDEEDDDISRVRCGPGTRTVVMLYGYSLLLLMRRSTSISTCRGTEQRREVSARHHFVFVSLAANRAGTAAGSCDWCASFHVAQPFAPGIFHIYSMVGSWRAYPHACPAIFNVVTS